MIFITVSSHRKIRVKQKSTILSTPTFFNQKNKSIFYILPHSLKKNNINILLSYSLLNKINQTLYIHKNSFQLLDNFKSKKITITRKLLSDNIYSFYKNVLLKNKYLHILSLPITRSSFIATYSKQPYDNLHRLKHITSDSFFQYSLWSKIFNKNSRNIFGSHTLKKSNTHEITKDITSGLLNIENLLEAEISTTLSIFKGINIISQINTNHETFLTDHKYQLLLFSIERKKNYLYMITHKTKPLYGTISSLLTPNISMFNAPYSLNQLLISLYLQYSNFFTSPLASKFSFFFMYNLIVESLLKQYLAYGITIPSIHFELLTSKMTSFVKISHPAESSLGINDIVELSKVNILNNVMSCLNYRNILYFPIILGITKSVSIHTSKLSSLNFQGAFKYLTKLSLENMTD